MGFEVQDLSALDRSVYVEEDGDSFLENAFKKALTLAKVSGVAVLADDSGLAVEALDGRPGVRSARFAGEGASDEANNLKLLADLAGVPKKHRGAAFVCAMALKLPDGREFSSEGRLEGEILESPMGVDGFGYDPLFRPLGESRTLAQMSLDEKNKISHRGRALEGLLPALFLLGTPGADQSGISER